MPTISERHHKRARSLSSLRAVLVIALLSLMCALPDVSLAQTAATGSRSQGEVSTISMQLSDEIYSPFCPGKTLSMCPSPNAAKVRRDIQRMAREGMSKDEIKQEFVSLDAVEADEDDEDFDADENLVDMSQVSGAMRDAFGE